MGQDRLESSLPVWCNARIIMPTNRFHSSASSSACPRSDREALASTPVTPNLLVNGTRRRQRCNRRLDLPDLVPAGGSPGAASGAVAMPRSTTPARPRSCRAAARAARPCSPRPVPTPHGQSVDVSAAASAIDHGTVGFTLSAGRRLGRTAESATLTASSSSAAACHGQSGHHPTSTPRHGIM